jgi:SAM-dependent methyltransferase
VSVFEDDGTSAFTIARRIICRKVRHLTPPPFANVRIACFLISAFHAAPSFPLLSSCSAPPRPPRPCSATFPMCRRRWMSVKRMLELADVKKGEFMMDLGSGDGRIAIMAAKDYGAKAVGIDIDPQRIKEANENAKKEGVTDRVEFIQANLFEYPIKDANVITMYLLTSVNAKLRPRLLDELRPGTRLVSHCFDMGDWEPDESRSVDRPQRLSLDRAGQGRRPVERQGRRSQLHGRYRPGVSDAERQCDDRRQGDSADQCKAERQRGSFSRSMSTASRRPSRARSTATRWKASKAPRRHRRAGARTRPHALRSAAAKHAEHPEMTPPRKFALCGGVSIRA